GRRRPRRRDHVSRRDHPARRALAPRARRALPGRGAPRRGYGDRAARRPPRACRAGHARAGRPGGRDGQDPVRGHRPQPPREHTAQGTPGGPRTRGPGRRGGRRRGDRGVGAGAARRDVLGLRARRVRGDLRPARLADDRPRQSGKRPRGPEPVDRRPRLDHQGVATSRIAVLGLGEAGGRIAADLAAAGVEVRGYDPVVSPGDRDAVVADAAAVLSLVTAAAARDAAAAALPGLPPGALYADLNAAAPELKRELAALVPSFVDVALLGPVPV